VHFVYYDRVVTVRRAAEQKRRANAMAIAQPLKQCPTCQASTDAQWFCRSCGEFLRAPGTERGAANLWRRFAAHLLDNILFWLLLFVGWFIWFGFFTAKNGQTPGKQLLGLRVMRIDGTIPTPGQMWLREVVIKGVVWGLVAGALSIIAYIWAFFDRDRQTVHDKMLNTYVVHHPGPVEEMTPVPITPEELYGSSGSGLSIGFGGPTVQPRSAQESVGDVDQALRSLLKMREDGLITAEEYEEKRQALIGRL
jgi:uncharacterized RDD family membrane protein YckC